MPDTQGHHINIPLPIGCSCVGVEIGSYANQVELPTPLHMLSLGALGCYEFRPTTCVDSCLAPLVQALWAAGVVTTVCCCGHNKRQGYIGIWAPVEQLDEPSAVKYYLTADSIESLLAAVVPSGSVCDPQQVADAIRSWFAQAPRSGDAPVAAEPFGWAVLDKHGCAERVVTRLHYEYGASEPVIRAGVAHDLLPYLDREYAGLAPHRIVPLYTAAPVSAPAGKIAAWHTDDGRTISAKQKSDAERSGGASASSVAAYSIPSYFGCAPADARDAGGNHGLDTDTHVFFYEQDFYVLSNFSAFRVTFNGTTFDTSEAAYHYQRFTSAEDRHGVLYTESAHDSFRYAQAHKANQRADWDAVKFDVMRDILRAKAQQHEYVRRKLLATGDRILVENSWRDPVWGWGPNRDGQNMLGKLWMEIRAELRASDSAKGAKRESVPACGRFAHETERMQAAWLKGWDSATGDSAHGR